MLNEHHIVNMNMDVAFDIFQKSYTKATGKSWDKDKFINRARDWEFYGDDNGFVAAREQRSGLIKLVGAAGSLKSVYKGMQDIQHLYSDKSVWGLVSKDIGSQLERLGFYVFRLTGGISDKLMITFIKNLIPSSVLGGASITGIDSNGILNLNYGDVGAVDKVLIGNTMYFNFLINNIQANEKIPNIMKNKIISTIDNIING